MCVDTCISDKDLSHILDSKHRFAVRILAWHFHPLFFSLAVPRHNFFWDSNLGLGIVSSNNWFANSIVSDLKYYRLS